MKNTLKINFEKPPYLLSYTPFFKSHPPDYFLIFNSEEELLKFAPAQFEIIYFHDKYPNWRFSPSYGDRFDNLRIAIFLSLIDTYPDRYMAGT